MREIAIEFVNVDMKFDLGVHKSTTLKEYFISSVKHSRESNEFYAIKDISLQIFKGDRVGLIGANGAGKSTFLKLVSNVMQPTSGSIIINGKVAPLLELGAGFDPELSGKENIFINGAILGKGKAFIQDKYDEIVEFSELGRFIDVPVKNYSSGMRTKLGFSVATTINPDILLLDEIFGIGDQRFRIKSSARMREMIDNGNTAVISSHKLETIIELTDKTIWLDHGRLAGFGETQDICDRYLEFIKENKNVKHS